MEVKSAMLASSLNLTPTLSASATALFPASSARIAAPALSMEGTSATARSPWKARPPPRIVAPSLSTPVTAHSLWKRTTIYAQVDAALRKIRDTSGFVQSFAS
ncbi:hypothetical protein ZEAMMB73_Zm00001d019451 [Zea mays]|uniref:Uncharacterized protein n=1 Tax=Zea mays TaxID=4577 RepID=A0A1D6HXJ8_MAIZE|nr:hypothetical protein ZEAMMB73_Zm00001d019451 [Zea mays]